MAISDTIKKGVIRAPHRSLLRATGVVKSDADFDKPFIAICNSFVQIIPGHAHLDVVGKKVREAVYAAGGLPFEFNTIGVDDGIAMGHGGMKYSLASREIIADCSRNDVAGPLFRRRGVHSQLRQDRAGHDDGGGAGKYPGDLRQRRADEGGRKSKDGKAIDLATVFEAVGMVSANKMSLSDLAGHRGKRLPHLRQLQRDVHRQQHELFVRSAGPGAAGQRQHPGRTDPARDELFKEAGRRIVDLVKKNIKPQRHPHSQGVRKCFRAGRGDGRAAPTPCCTRWRWRSKRGQPFPLAHLNEVSARVPYLCKVAPAGKYHMEDVFRAGGISAILKTLAGKPGTLDLTCITVTGNTLGRKYRRRDVKDADVIRPLDNPYSHTGGLAVMFGNLAPNGGGAEDRRGRIVACTISRGPAVIFESEESAAARRPRRTKSKPATWS